LKGFSEKGVAIGGVPKSSRKINEKSIAYVSEFNYHKNMKLVSLLNKLKDKISTEE
jgi:hypothetical protein